MRMSNEINLLQIGVCVRLFGGMLWRIFHVAIGGRRERRGAPTKPPGGGHRFLTALAHTINVGIMCTVKNITDITIMYSTVVKSYFKRFFFLIFFKKHNRYFIITNIIRLLINDLILIWYCKLEKYQHGCFLPFAKTKLDSGYRAADINQSIYYILLWITRSLKTTKVWSRCCNCTSLNYRLKKTEKQNASPDDGGTVLAILIHWFILL